MTKALVILSGGQDSTLCLWLAKQSFKEVAAVTFNYGQRHARELEAARQVCTLMGITEHEVVDIGPILKGTSPLTNKDEQLEQYSDFKSMDAIIGDRVEKTFVPMRNALFLTLAANRAVVMGASNLYTGVCQADNANYPDCRQDFVQSQRRTINEALGRTLSMDNYINVHTPLMNMNKASSIDLAISSGAYPYLAFSHTAYDGAYPPVGSDHATILRAQGFLEAGVPDPLIVRANWEELMELPSTPNYDGVRKMDSYAEQLVSRIVSFKRKLAVGVAA